MLRRAPTHALKLVVRAYQLLLSPAIGPVCRYYPSCSNYAMQALERHGAVAGTYLAAARVLRCNPWCLGGCDPVPEQAPLLFRRLGFGAAAPTSSPSSSLTQTEVSP
ncbi:MAG: membrane protein insertion efficiency factor YidD [Pelomonas sp.]|nr:membrane protein insertion efficiency factor YidD [Roseateles sp.]